MPISGPLNVTPRSTVSTLQFQQEPINVITTSLIAVLILANLGSIISKLVFCTHKQHFCYKTFLRAYIFLNSDDPARLISWGFRSYPYRDSAWSRQDNVLRLKRLFIPVIARVFLLIASIASIAITIPSEKALDGCDRGDHGPLLLSQNFLSPPTPQPLAGPVCNDVELINTLGTIRSRVSYCSVPASTFVMGLTGPSIIINYFSDTATLSTSIVTESQLIGSDVYVEWRNEINEVFRSEVLNWQSTTHFEIALRALRSRVDDGCDMIGDTFIIPTINSVGVNVTCSFDVDTAKDVSRVMDAYMRESIEWRRLRDAAPRLAIRDDGWRKVNRCVMDITVTRPIVNIVPLAVTLLMLFTVNIAVGITVSDRGNVLDGAFHLVKETLGHDCTSNALEENEVGERVMMVQLRKWACSDGVGAHVGFLRGEGDLAVEAFAPNTVVTRCSRSDGSAARTADPVGEAKKEV